MPIGQENEIINGLKQNTASQKNASWQEDIKSSKQSYTSENNKINDHEKRYEQQFKQFDGGDRIEIGSGQQQRPLKATDQQQFTKQHFTQGNQFYQPAVGVNNDLYGGFYQQQPIQNIQQLPANQTWQYAPNAYNRDLGQYQNITVDRSNYSTDGLVNLNKPVSDFLSQSGNLQVSLLEEQKNVLQTNIGEALNRYRNQADEDDKKNEDKCKNNNKDHKKEMDGLDKKFDKEMKNINASLKNLVKNAFADVDDNLQASRGGVVSIYRFMANLAKDFKEKAEALEDSKGAYEELQLDLQRMADGNKFDSIKKIKASLIEYENFIGRQYSRCVFISFFYYLFDLLFGSNYHSGFIDLSANIQELQQAIDELDEMPEDKLDQCLSEVVRLTNKHRRTLADMSTYVFNTGRKDTFNFAKDIGSFLKIEGFDQKKVFLALFNVCGADIFSVAYMESSEGKKSSIIDMLAEKLDFSDPETKKTGEEIFGSIGVDFKVRKKAIIKAMLESKEEDDKKINEILTMINNSEELDNDDIIEMRKRVISKYCGGQFAELMNKTLSKKFKEKTSLQEQLYYVSIINAENSDFDAKSKRVKRLISDVTSEINRYFNQQLNNVGQFQALESMRNINFSSFHFKEQGKTILTNTLSDAVAMLKRVVEEELGSYAGDVDDLKGKKDIIKKGIDERKGEDGKIKDRKAYDVSRLEDWKDRNLNKEGSELKQHLLQEISDFNTAMEERIKKNFTAFPALHRVMLGEELKKNSNETQGIYKDIAVKQAEASKENFDQAIKVLSSIKGGGFAGGAP